MSFDPVRQPQRDLVGWTARPRPVPGIRVRSSKGSLFDRRRCPVPVAVVQPFVHSESDYTFPVGAFATELAPVPSWVWHVSVDIFSFSLRASSVVLVRAGQGAVAVCCRGRESFCCRFSELLNCFERFSPIFAFLLLLVLIH